MERGGIISFENWDLWPVFSAFQSTLIDRCGRKVLLWGGYTLMCSVLALLTMTLSLQVKRQQPSGYVPSISPPFWPCLTGYVQKLESVAENTELCYSVMYLMAWYHWFLTFSISFSGCITSVLSWSSCLLSSMELDHVSTSMAMLGGNFVSYWLVTQLAEEEQTSPMVKSSGN